MYYTLTADTSGSVLTVILSDGTNIIMNSDDTGFDTLKLYVLSTPSEDIDENRVKQLAHTPEGIVERMRQVSERVSISGNELFFDGDPIDNALSRTIVEMAAHDTDGPFEALVNFLEKLQTNPSAESREHLYEFITRYDVRILPSGSFTLYKGVMLGSDGESLSISTGTAYVDGERVNGHIPNPTGAVITMPRSDVNSDRYEGCSTGLHAGTWSYASGFARGRVVLVEINPRDVVSVPEDCTFQKVRVSRYTVRDEIDHEIDVYGEYGELYADYDDEGDFDDDYERDEAWGDVYEEAQWDTEVLVGDLLDDGNPPEDIVESLLGETIDSFIENTADSYVTTVLLYPEDYSRSDLRMYVLEEFTSKVYKK